MLNATDAAGPIQDRLTREASGLNERWNVWFDQPIEMSAARQLVQDTRGFLAAVPSQAQATQSHLMEIVMAQDFQDLTGQRLKKVVCAIASIRETVFDLYVSTGLMMKTHAETPEKSLKEIVEESRRKVQEIRNSELKGPQRETSQKDVDDLLSSLGM